jgi:hypothetical protein
MLDRSGPSIGAEQPGARSGAWDISRLRLQRWARGGRRRRGVEFVEFALILPIACVMLFSTMEFAWYMYQRGSVVDAARLGCRAAAQLDPELDDIAGAAAARIQAELDVSGVNCNAGCNIQITDLVGFDPPRVECDVRVPYVPLTGILGQSGSGGSLHGAKISEWSWDGFGVLPDTLHGLGTAVFEGED